MLQAVGEKIMGAVKEFAVFKSFLKAIMAEIINFGLGPESFFKGFIDFFFSALTAGIQKSFSKFVLVVRMQVVKQVLNLDFLQ